MEIEGTKRYKLMDEAKRRNNLFYSILIITLIVIIGGTIIFIIGPRDFGIVLMAVGGIIAIPMTFFLSLILSAQRKISKLYKKRDSEKLISYVSEKSSLTKGYIVYYAVAALGDMREVKALPILEKILMKSYYNAKLGLQKKTAEALASIGTDKAVTILRNALIKNDRQINRFGARGTDEQLMDQYLKSVSNAINSALNSLAKTNNYNSIDVMIRDVEKRKRKVQVREEYRGEKGVSFKIPYVEEEAKCMISHLILDEEEKEITACPHCLNIAKTELMTMWLSKKNKCPICRRKITIEECLQVEFRQKEKDKE